MAEQTTTTTEDTAKTSETLMSAGREALDKLAAAEDGSARNDDGRFTDENPATPGAGAEPGTDSEPAEVDPDDLDRALTALGRTNAPKELLESMKDSNPQQLVEWGERLAEQHRQTDNLGNANRLLEAENTKLRLEQVDAEPSKGKPASQDSEPTKEVAAVLDQLTESYGEDLAKPLGDLIKTVETGQKVRADALQARLDRLEGATDKATKDAVRPELEARFPKIERDSEWGKVCSRADELLRSGASADLTDAMNDAATLRYAAEMMETAKGKKATLSKAKKNGQPDAGGKRHNESPAPIKDPRARGMEVLTRLSGGDSPAQAKAWADKRK